MRWVWLNKTKNGHIRIWLHPILPRFRLQWRKRNWAETKLFAKFDDNPFGRVAFALVDVNFHCGYLPGIAMANRRKLPNVFRYDLFAYDFLGGHICDRYISNATAQWASATRLPWILSQENSHIQECTVRHCDIVEYGHISGANHHIRILRKRIFVALPEGYSVAHHVCVHILWLRNDPADDCSRHLHYESVSLQ